MLTASVFGGFPLSDIPHTGLSVIVVSDGDKAAGDALRDELLDLAWERRADFIHDFEPMTASIARATSVPVGPVVLHDHGDNCGAGGVTDVMAVLGECLDQGLDDIVAGPYCDPEAAAILIDALPFGMQPGTLEEATTRHSPPRWAAMSETVAAVSDGSRVQGNRST